jgi:uncharacterized repeat protein (TIGR03803 family)
MRTFRLTLMISGTLWIALQAQAASPVLTTLYNFKGGSSDGANPDTGVTIGPGGALFGNTAEGGASDNGVLFALTPPASPGGTWTETAHAFPYYTGGAYGLVAGPSALYGTTFNGGTSGSGTVYSIALLAGPGQGRVLYEFSPGADGVNPKASATIGSGGVLYGPTYEDGANGCGTVFALTPPASAGGAWTESTIYSLTTNDGCGQLDAALVIGSGGVIYAADEIGGPAGVGRVFSLTPPAAPGGAWTHTVLYDFKGPSDGIYPVGLTLSDGGVIYGAANRGGPHGFGTVFSLTPAFGCRRRLDRDHPVQFHRRRGRRLSVLRRGDRPWSALWHHRICATGRQHLLVDAACNPRRRLDRGLAPQFHERQRWRQPLGRGHRQRRGALRHHLLRREFRRRYGLLGDALSAVYRVPAERPISRAMPGLRLLPASRPPDVVSWQPVLAGLRRISMSNALRFAAACFLLAVATAVLAQPTEQQASGASKTPTYIEFDVPGAGTADGQGTVGYSINTAGVIAGYYSEERFLYHGFVRSASGAITSFDAPGAGTGTGQGTIPASINSDGVITGSYSDGSSGHPRNGSRPHTVGQEMVIIVRHEQ